MHEGSTNPRLKQELRSATGLALRAGKVAAQSLGKAMSTGVVQEHHQWLCLVERSDVDKVSFLDTLISKACLFGDTVEDCAQQFSAVQKQTEATHLAPAWCSAPPQSKTQSACRRGRPPVPSRVREQVSSGSAPCWIISRRVEPHAGAWCPLCSSWPLYRPERRWSGPDTDNPEMWEPAWFQEMARTAPLLPPKEGRGRIIHSVPPLAQGPAVPSLSSKNNSLSSEFSGPRVDSVRRIASSLSPATHFASGQESAVRGRSTSPRTSSQSLQGLREFCEDESERRAFCTIQPYSHSLHHCGYVDCAVGASCTASGGVACAAQPVSLAHAHNSTRLRDSVRQATSQVQRRSRDCGAARNAPVLREEIAVLLARMQSSRSLQPRWSRGFTALISSYPRKTVVFDQSWIATPEPGPARLPFKMLTHRRMIKCIQPRDWFAAIDLKDAYFHVSILPRHRPFYGLRPRVGHGSTGSSPSGSPCPPVSSRRSRRVPLPRYGKWASGSSTVSSMARTREQLCDHRDLVLRHLSQLGLRVNWEKSKLSPAQRISFLGVELDSVSMSARLTEERAQSVLNCLSSFGGRTVVPLKQFQRLLGHMASAAAVTPLGLLHMRPLQHWLHSRVPRWAWRRGALQVNITQECRRSFSPWTDLAFLRAGVPLEQVSRHVVVTTDASSTGWGATCNGQAASGLWMGPRLLWHINCLELLAVHLALRQFRPLLLGKHVLVRTDNTAAVSYINRMGGIRSRRMSQLARHLLLWSHTRLKSLRAVHIPGVLNRAADALSRQLTFPGEWRLHPETIRLIWSRFGEAQVDLFASRESSHCQWFFSLTEGSLGTDALAHSWPRALCKYAFPPVSLLAQTLCKVREDEEQVLLVAPFWPTRTWFPELILLATAPPWPIPLRKDFLSQGLGTIGTRVQTCGTSMCGSWMGRGRLEWSPTGGGRDHHSGWSSFYKASLCTEVESVREPVFFSPRRPPKMHDWSSAFFPARKVGA